MMLEVFIVAMTSVYAGVVGVYLLWDWLDERREETHRERARQKRLQLRHRPRKRRDKNLPPHHRHR